MANVFKALSDPTRLKIINLITESQNLCVGIIAEKTGMSQPAISQHLKTLKTAGILDSRKIGPEVHYSINQKTVNDLKENVTALFAKKPVQNCTECPKYLRKKKK